jgi:polyisoprenoid-binding protein YceI
MKTKVTLLTFVAASLMVSSCMQNPKGEKAQMGDAMDISKAEGIEYIANIGSTTIEWLGTKPGGSHFGNFPIQEGRLLVKEQTIVGGEMTIDMNSLVVTDIEDPKTNQMLVSHLKSADFFAVDSFPTAKFEIAKVTPLDQTTNIDGIIVTHNIEGNLTLRGVTRSVSFPSAVTFAEGKVEAKSPKFIVNRTHWKANYGSPSIFANLKDKFINDEVALNVSLVAEIKK